MFTGGSNMNLHNFPPRVVARDVLGAGWFLGRQSDFERDFHQDRDSRHCPGPEGLEGRARFVIRVILNLM